MLKLLFILFLSWNTLNSVLTSQQLNYCTLKVDKNVFLRSWQTSSFENVCFNNLNPEYVGKATYFHSNIFKHHNDNEFSWLVVELKNVTKAAEFGFKNRDCTSCDDTLKQQLSSRASDIEIWTSNVTQMQFNDPCKATDIGSNFNANINKWNKCGITPKLNEIHVGQSLTVVCEEIRLVKFVLLRKKYVRNEEELRQYMGFADMWIVKPRGTDVSIQPSQNQLRGSKVTIRCLAHCILSETVHLCLPNGHCLPPLSEFRTDRVQPSDSGNYTCTTGDPQVDSTAELKVQYPPDNVTISPMSLISCGDSNSPADVEFDVSSAFAEPEPTHNCTALDGSTRHQIMRMKNLSRDSVSSRLTSRWICVNCSRTAKLSVTCTASQHSVIKWIADWKCEPTSGMDISFSKERQIDNILQVSFTVATQAATPAPKHKCRATFSDYRPVEVIYLSSAEKQSTNGYTITKWTARVSLPWKRREKLYVQCNATARSAWHRRAAAVWQKPWEVSKDIAAASVIVIVVLAAIISFGVAAVFNNLKSKFQHTAGALEGGNLRIILPNSGNQQQETKQHQTAADDEPEMYSNTEADCVYELVQQILEVKDGADENEVYVS